MDCGGCEESFEGKVDLARCVIRHNSSMRHSKFDLLGESIGDRKVLDVIWGFARWILVSR